jgi:hypothetical protein
MTTWLKPNTIRLKCRPPTAFIASPGPMWNGVNGIEVYAGFTRNGPTFTQLYTRAIVPKRHTRRVAAVFVPPGDSHD